MLQFRRAGVPEFMRRASFVGMAAAIGWLIAVGNAKDNAHQEHVRSLEKRVDDLSTVVRVLASEQTGESVDTPLIITVPADEKAGTPERVIVVPPAAAQSTTTTTGASPPPSTTSSTTPASTSTSTTTSSSTTTSTTRCDAGVLGACVTLP